MKIRISTEKVTVEGKRLVFVVDIEALGAGNLPEEYVAHKDSLILSQWSGGNALSSHGSGGNEFLIRENIVYPELEFAESLMKVFEAAALLQKIKGDIRLSSNSGNTLFTYEF